MAVLAGGALRRPSRFRYWRQWLTAYLFLAPWLIFRVAWYRPCVASSVVATLILMWLFLPDVFINAALSFIGINLRINGLGDEATALPSIMFMNIWATAATFMLTFRAAMQDVRGPI